MDLQLLMPWLLAAATILNLGSTIVTLLTAGSKKNATDLEKFKSLVNRLLEETDKRLDTHESRIQALENDIKHLPDREMVHNLQLTLKDIQIEMASIKSATEQSTRTSRRVEEFLMSAGGRKAS